MAAYKLNPFQKNYLWAILYHFENALQQSGELLNTKRAHGFLSVQQCDVSAQKKEKIIALIAIAHKKIGNLTKKLGLENQSEETSKQIIGLMNSSWVNLIGVNAKQLRAYGNIDDTTARSIEDAFANLAQIANDIQNLVE